MRPTTRALHSSIDDRDAAPSVLPLYQNSAFQAHSPYFYTRKNNPNVASFEQVVATLEGARHAVAVSTGMAAISSVLTLLAPGDTVVLNQLVYGCSFKLFQRVAKRLGLDLRIVSLSSKQQIEKLPPKTRMVFFETPTNPFLRTVDVGAVARQAKATNPEALVVVDNTWATPLYQHPLELGADISLHSATKYLSGHSDVMGGIVLTDRADLEEELRASRFYYGAVMDPHSAWLLCRSMQTFGIRMEAHHQTTLRMVEFLRKRPEVRHVYYPEVDGHQLKRYGTLVFFDLREDLVEHYPTFAKSLELFSTGTGMAAVTSMVAQPYSGSHASMTPEEKAEMGLGPGLVRLSFGLEDPEDLKADLARAFEVVEQARAAAAGGGGSRLGNRSAAPDGKGPM